ncbi:hypothetical protein PTTG_07879 [Puccinia triticina 1-1 BBBD Race 1]|uniref:Uncharacterized protein n=1 Tax=Puccinia triticina (isolate 1-1 / race 1 (BBBD)) TaxID=630390 RepID=A0A180GHR4_PUCT1|nr:hypothetical protein PTTG_07879 [Puccinia triticina 1-1 BBBD Race 1]
MTSPSPSANPTDALANHMNATAEIAQVPAPSVAADANDIDRETVLEGLNRIIHVQFEYLLYANIQNSGQGQVKQKQITSKGSVPPMDLCLNDCKSMSFFKTFVMEHFRTKSRHVYPINIMLGQAERNSAVYWSWHILEPPEFEDIQYSFNEPRGTFDLFISAAEKSHLDASVTVFLDMLDDVIILMGPLIPPSQMPTELEI